MKFKGLVVIFLTLVMTVGIAGTVSAGALADIVKRGELRVAVQSGAAPYAFIDKNGNPTGSMVEFSREMAKRMGVKLKVLDFDWDGLIPALLSGKADILAADMTPTLKRALKITFCDPLYYVQPCVFTTTGATYQNPEDVNKPDITVGVLLGSTGEDYGVSYLNSIMLDTDDPLEISVAFDSLRDDSAIAHRMRAAARETAHNFTWQNVVRNVLLSHLQYVALRQLVLAPPQESAPTPAGPGEILGPNTAHTGPHPATGQVARPADERPSRIEGSLAYRGESTTQRLSVEPPVSPAERQSAAARAAAVLPPKSRARKPPARLTERNPNQQRRCKPSAQANEIRDPSFR